MAAPPRLVPATLKLAFAVLGLALVAFAAVLVLDAVQVSAPALRHSCGEASSRLLSPYRSYCRWDQYRARPAADGRSPGRSAQLRLHQGDDGAFRATAVLVAPASDPLVTAVRRGDAADDPGMFVSTLCGGASLDDDSFRWTRPTVAPNADGSVRITSQGSPAAPPRAADDVQALTLFLNTPGKLLVEVHRTPVVGVQYQYGKWTDADADARVFTLRPESTGSVRLLLGSESPVPFTGPPAPGAPSWLSTVLAGLRSGLANQAPVLLTVAPWAVLLVLTRIGALGRWGTKRSWRLAMAVSGAAVAAHLVVTGVSVVVAAGPTVSRALADATVSRRLSSALGWEPVGYVQADGAIVLAMALLFVVVPVAWGRWPVLASIGGPRLRPPQTLGIAGAAVAFTAASVGAMLCLYFSLLREPAAEDLWMPIAASGVLVLLGVVASGVLAGAAVLPGIRWSLLAAAGVAVALTVLATVHWQGGLVPYALRWGVWISAGTIAVIAVAQLFAIAVAGGRLPRRTVVWAAPLAALFVASWAWPRTGNAGWWQLQTLLLRLDGVTGLAIAVAVVAALRRAGRRPVIGADDLRVHRMLGIALTFAVLTTAYSMVARTSVPAFLAAAVAAWLLFPRSSVDRAAEVLRQTDAQHAAAVVGVVRAGNARRALGDVQKKTREQVADGTWDLAKAQSHIETVEQVAYAGGALARDRAFAGGFTRRPWSRARWSVLAALAVGSPWIVLALVGTGGELIRGSEGYPALAAVGAVAPIVLRWAGYGLIFGYFFPLLRGHNGLTKGAWLFLAVAAPADVGVVTSSGTADWSGVLLPATQAFAFALTLGLLADRKVLADRGFAAARLVDVHNLGSVTAWASSIAVALATGIATIVIAGLQPFVIGLINQPAAPAPPAVVTGNR